MSLTIEQRNAIKTDESVFLHACPGSGKTRVIVAKLLNIIFELRGSPRYVACITYTNTAVNEIENRLLKDLQPDDENHFQVSTIHSFCLNNIFRFYCWDIPSFKRGFRVISRDMDDFERIVTAACATIGYAPRFQDFEDFAGLGRDSDGLPTGSSTTSQIVENCASAYWSLCEKEGFIDFSNILYHSLVLLRNHPEVVASLASKFAWLLVDEFQDTSEIQVAILTLIAAEQRTKFFLVGDTYQSIFGFAGARPELSETFATQIAARTDLSLSGNFRSSPKIIHHAEKIFPRNPPMNSVGASRIFTEEPTYYHASSPLQAITDYFIPTLISLGIPFGESSILAPSWGALFPISRSLREFGYNVIGPGARPYRRSRLFAVLAESLCAYIASPRTERLSAIERALFFSIQEITGSPRFDVYSYKGRVLILKMIQQATSFTDLTDAAIPWLDRASLTIGTLLHEHEFISRRQIDSFHSSVQEMKRDMIASRIDLANLSIADLGLFGEPEGAIRLSTLHFSKGREFEAVAIIKLHEGALPDYRATTPEEIEGTKRLFYVGVTRAKRLLMYITDYSDRRNRPSRYLGASGVDIIKPSQAA